MSTEESTDEKGKKKYGNVKPIVRKGKSDSMADFTAINRVFIKLFRERLPEFTAFDPQLDSAYADKWEQLNEELSAMPTDETMLDALNAATEETFTAYAPVLKLADELEFFVDKAFAEEERRGDEFGFKLLRSVSGQTNLKFTLYAYTLSTIYPDYETELLAAGLPATWAADYENAVGEAGNREIMQERAKRMRIRATTNRVLQHNRIYTMWKSVNKASKVIYRSQPEMMKWWEW